MPRSPLSLEAVVQLSFSLHSKATFDRCDLLYPGRLNLSHPATHPPTHHCAFDFLSGSMRKVPSVTGRSVD